jgi:hypothetical protein
MVKLGGDQRISDSAAGSMLSHTRTTSVSVLVQLVDRENGDSEATAGPPDREGCTVQEVQLVNSMRAYATWPRRRVDAPRGSLHG